MALAAREAASRAIAGVRLINETQMDVGYLIGRAKTD
jgi:hypothetical protein